MIRSSSPNPESPLSPDQSLGAYLSQVYRASGGASDENQDDLLRLARRIPLTISPAPKMSRLFNKLREFSKNPVFDAEIHSLARAALKELRQNDSDDQY